MIVEIYIRGFAPHSIPMEDQPPLLINPDRVQTIQSATEFLEVIARRGT